MHVLLLKEPRDEESGPDPYIRVNALVVCTLFRCVFSADVSTTLHFLEIIDRKLLF